MESAERKRQIRRRRLPRKYLCVSAALTLPSEVQAHGFHPRSFIVHKPSHSKVFLLIRGGDNYDNDTSNEETSDILSSPFLDQFQEEVHRIVSDYRAEVRQTFEQLRKDLLASQALEEETVKDEAASEKDSLASDETQDVAEESDERDEQLEVEDDLYFPYKRADEEEFVVGDTDEEEEHVLERLSHSEEVEEGSDTLPGEDTVVEDELDSGLFKSTMEKTRKKQKRKKKKKKRRPSQLGLDAEEVVIPESEEPVQTVIGFARPSAATSIRAVQVQLSRTLSAVLSFIILFVVLNGIIRILFRMLSRKS